MMMNRNFIWLLKRELWEYRGAMLWTPVIVGCVMCVLLALGLMAGGMLGHNLVVSVNGETVADAAAALGDQRMEHVVKGIAIGFMFTLATLFLVPALVIFFYCLGTLYDERRDRSVLFWKSLPISDTATVLSKVVTAVLVAPAITLVVASVTAYIVLAMGAVAASMMGGGVLVAGALFKMNLLLAPLQVLALLPLYALWALPSVGWLLMVSAWARSKPFLWAMGLPIGVGVLLWWLNRMLHTGWNLGWYWSDVVGRGLFSTVPATWLFDIKKMDMPPPQNFGDVLAQSWYLVGTPGLWLGVLAGAAMVVVAIRLRRWRDQE